MKTHGGKRKGAGKPARYGKAMKRINVMLDQETIEFYKQHGASLSEGIRNYWRGITHTPADVLVRCVHCDALLESDVHCDNCGSFHPTRR